MTEIEQKALALVNEIERNFQFCENELTSRIMRGSIWDEAICRAIEQHEAFRREVSDEMEAYSKRCKSMGLQFPLLLERFIINADVPDALVDVWGDLFTKGYNLEQFRAALEARGLQIRETGQ